MTGEQYDQRECELCLGGGQRYDATNADKLCTGGASSAPCSRCRGTGSVLVLRPSPEFIAYRDAERAALRNVPTEIGSLPDWMME
jgi:RecJ-like exonuclease